jgi:hypothetical protein
VAVALDAKAIGLGAVTAIAGAVPPLLVYQGLYNADIIGKESPVALLFYGFMMLGFAFGGFVAGVRAPDAPMSHGALATLAGFLTVQLIAGAVVLARGDSLNIVKIAFNAMLSSGLGVVGGLLSTQRRTATT